MAWNRPNITVRVNVLKNVMKMWDEEEMRRMIAMKVVIPPLRTAGPMVTNAFTDRSSLVPRDARNPWAMCTA